MNTQTTTAPENETPKLTDEQLAALLAVKPEDKSMLAIEDFCVSTDDADEAEEMKIN